MERRLDQVVGARDEIARRPWLRLLVAGICVAMLAGTCVADAFSGRDVSLGVVYLIPVMVATILIGRAAGVALTATGFVFWIAVDYLSPGGTGNREVIEAVNDVLRVVIFMLVVTLLSALINSLLSTRAANARTRCFLADAAHQLRTPLSGLSAASQALLLDPEPREREELLARIGGESLRAGRLVGSLLRIARLDQGEAARIEITSPRRLLDEAASRWTSRWPQLELVVAAAPSLPERALFADDVLREIIDNLLDNACRHAANRITLTAASLRDCLEIRVEDDGAGVPAGQHERVFERFVCLDLQGGSGLGLPIARQLARASGGDLVYRQHAFFVTLPWQPFSERAVTSQVQPTRRGRWWPLEAPPAG